MSALSVVSWWRSFLCQYSLTVHLRLQNQPYLLQAEAGPYAVLCRCDECIRESGPLYRGFWMSPTLRQQHERRAFAASTTPARGRPLSRSHVALPRESLRGGRAAASHESIRGRPREEASLPYRATSLRGMSRHRQTTLLQHIDPDMLLLESYASSTSQHRAGMWPLKFARRETKNPGKSAS